jgi:hypothetical protein
MRNAPGAAAGGHKRKARGKPSIKSARDYRIVATIDGPALVAERAAAARAAQDAADARVRAGLSRRAQRRRADVQ